MSHIIKSEKDKKNLSSLLEEFKNKGYNNDIIYELLNYMIPKNDNYQVEPIIQKNKNNQPAYFMPAKKQISVDLELLRYFINKYLIDDQYYWLKNYCSQITRDELYCNFIVMVIAHEVEHLYQYLIGYECINFPYTIVKESYKNIFDLIIKPTKKTNLNKLIHEYRDIVKNTPTLLLERNVNIESINLICKIAEYENNKNIHTLFNRFKSAYLLTGYQTIYNGSVEETYCKFLAKKIYKSFNKTEEISTEERIRYGLPISKTDKKKLLKKEIKFNF